MAGKVRRPRVLLAGGGSGGSTTPILAVVQALRRKRPDVDLLYVGTVEGPERILVERDNIPFTAVHAGKLRRYFSPANFVDPFRVLAGVVQSVLIVGHFRPTIGFGAGGFASFPPLVGCWLHGVPVVTHQQDVVPGLANRLITPIACLVSVGLKASLDHFPKHKSVWTGNPVRATVLSGDAEAARTHFGLETELPTILITGGGTGALAVNQLVADAAERLVEFCQIIHLTGRGRAAPIQMNSSRYHGFELLVEDMPLALAVADLVVSRAGMATLTELSGLGKPALIIPMPDSHQEANARAFAALDACRVLDQKALTGTALAQEIRQLLSDPARLLSMSRAMRDTMPANAAERVAGLLLELAES